MTDNEASVTLNTEQRLYVIPSTYAQGKVSGYSCLGYDVLERRGNAYAAWLASRIVTAGRRPVYLATDAALGAWRGTTPSTLGRYGAYSALVNAVIAVCRATGQQCDADLTPPLRGLEGHRVEVVDTFPGAKPRRFIVSKSTGWIPCHLELAKRNSSGGMAAWHEYASVRDLGKVR